MKVLMVAPQPFFRARGTPFSVLHRIRALLEGGHLVDLITYPFGDDVDLPGLRIIRCRRPPGIRDVRIGPSPAKLVLDASLYLESRRMLKSGRYDVLHSHEEASFFCAGLARRHGLPHVYDMHSSLPQQLGNFRAYDLGLLRRTFTALEGHVLQTCSGVITICPDLARLVDRKCPDKLHELIENTAANASVFPPDEHDVRRDLGIGPNERVVLYTGTFEAYQGIDLLIEAFARAREGHPDLRLIVVGGTAEQVARRAAQAKEVVPERSIVFTGTVHPSRIPGYIAASDLIVSPRCGGTNTPLKIYDYMRSQRPILATNLETHTQVLDEETAFLVEPSVDGLANGIRRVLADPEDAQGRARAAAARAEELFSEREYLDKVHRFYERLAETA